MSATMARQGGRAQLEQSNTHLALIMAKMAKWGFSRTAMEQMNYLINKLCAHIREVHMLGVKIPGHRKVNAGIERPLPMLHQNHMDACLPCQDSTAMNPQECWMRKSQATPPPDWHRQLTPESTPPLPRTPPAPPGDNERVQSSQINNVPPRYVYSHAPPPRTQFCNLDAYAWDSRHNDDFNPDMLTDEETSSC